MSEIKVVTYNPVWVQSFERESGELYLHLKKYLVNIQHIGSTAIPEMPAKPIIDFLLIVDDLTNIQEIETLLIEQGYAQLNRSVMPHRSYFTFKATNELKFNCHIYERGDPQITRQCRFRDYLVLHSDEASAYANLKQSILDQGETDITKYVLAKDAFVRDIDKKAKIHYANRVQLDVKTAQNKGGNKDSWSPEQLIASVEANCNLNLTYFAQFITDYTLIRCPGYVLVKSGLNDSYFNYILDAHFPIDQAEERTESLIDYFASKKLPFSWWLFPNDKPMSMNQLLTARLGGAEEWPVLYQSLDDLLVLPNSGSQRIELLRNRADFDQLISRLPTSQAYLKKHLGAISLVYTSDDPIQFYTCYVDDELIGCSALVLYAQLAGIYSITTLSHTEKSQVDFSLCLCKEAKKMGYHMAVEPINASLLTTYLTHGFEQLTTFKKYVSSFT